MPVAFPLASPKRCHLVHSCTQLQSQKQGERNICASAACAPLAERHSTGPLAFLHKQPMLMR